jgi:hypothetical protein
MTQTEQLMNDLRDAIRDELIAKLHTYRERVAGEGYDANYYDGIDDAINTLEQV